MQRRAERLIEAWREARGWFEAESGEEPVAVHVRWPGASLDGLRRGLLWIDEEATICYTSSVWLRRETFDAQVTGVGRSLEAFGDGRLASFSVHYEVVLERQTLGFLLTVAREDDGGLAARGFTQQNLVRPPLGPLASFETIAGHAMDLEERFGAAGMWIGPERDDLVKAVGEEGLGG